jgi:hypothetical protein
VGLNQEPVDIPPRLDLKSEKMREKAINILDLLPSVNARQMLWIGIMTGNDRSVSGLLEAWNWRLKPM